MDSPKTMVPLAAGDRRQVPEELKHLHNYYEEAKKEMSGRWSNLVSDNIKQLWTLNPNLKISQCVVFGLGKMDVKARQQRPLEDYIWEASAFEEGDDIDRVYEGQENTIHQLVILRMTLDCIEGVAHPIKVYFQDPDFTDLDKAYIRFHGYEIVEDPRGFDMVDSTTFVFDLNTYWPVTADIIQRLPAMHVGCRLENLWSTQLERYEHETDPAYHRPTPPPGEGSVIAPLLNLRTVGSLEDYTQYTNGYKFPMPMSERPPRESDAYRSFLLDEWMWGKFEIRILKTVHKDYQSS